MKARVVDEAIRIVSGEGNGEFEGAFEQLLPVTDGSLDKYYIWNKVQYLFDLMC